jgi:hypothetical protein
MVVLGVSFSMDVLSKRLAPRYKYTPPWNASNLIFDPARKRFVKY